MFKQIFEIFKSDSLYEQALSECHEMLDIDLTMFKESIKSLRESDSADINIDIFAMDKKINEFERDVRRKVMTHLAIGGKEDIGSGLILVSVVIDIERIGDYTKNIYDLAVNHPKKLNGGSLEDCIAEIELLRHTYVICHPLFAMPRSTSTPFHAHTNSLHFSCIFTVIGYHSETLIEQVVFGRPGKQLPLRNGGLDPACRAPVAQRSTPRRSTVRRWKMSFFWCYQLWLDISAFLHCN